MAEYLKAELRDAHALITSTAEKQGAALQEAEQQTEGKLAELARSSQEAAEHIQAVVLEMNEEVEQVSPPTPFFMAFCTCFAST